jgi:hypothetical protein
LAGEAWMPVVRKIIMQPNRSFAATEADSGLISQQPPLPPGTPDIPSPPPGPDIPPIPEPPSEPPTPAPPLPQDPPRMEL